MNLQPHTMPHGAQIMLAACNCLIGTYLQIAMSIAAPINILVCLEYD